MLTPIEFRQRLVSIIIVAAPIQSQFSPIIQLFS